MSIYFLLNALTLYIESVCPDNLSPSTYPRAVDYFFPGITQAKVQEQMRRVCLRAGLRPRTPHDLRHRYATLLLMAYVSPAYVQKQLGHHSITMTVDVYGHWMPGEGKKDLEKICGDQIAPDRHLEISE